MPAIITPPDLERRPRRTEENDGGHGRRPPNGHDLKRTGGGGDNDNGRDLPHTNRRPGHRLAAYRMGLAAALFAVGMFFAGIVTLFFHSQNAGHIDSYNRYINAWLPIAVPPILWLNTAILLVSSASIEIARRRMFDPFDAMEEWFGLGKPTSRRALPWLAVTLALGLLFLAGQMTAWHQMSALGAPYRSGSASSHSFYIITWAHAAHLTLGVIGLAAAITGLLRFKSVENRQIMVDMAAWYWHSMGALWICLFALLILFQ